VHYVNENVDSGEIIAQIPIEIKENMTLEELETGIHQVEHLLFPHVISHIFLIPL
jgi:phosphoribosylglycinamide formyltransferase-1